MKTWVSAAGLLGILLCFNSCGNNKKSHATGSGLSRQDSLDIARLDSTKKKLEPLQKYRENLKGPAAASGAALTRGAEISGSEAPAEFESIITEIDGWKSAVSKAGTDSTTDFGPLMTRGKIIDATQKFMNATYDRHAHLIYYYDHYDKGTTRYDNDYYFKDGSLVYYEHKVSEHNGGSAHLVQDEFYLSGGKVIYAFRDEGTDADKGKSINFVTVSRYQLNGDATGYVGNAFELFMKDYKVLLEEELEASIYVH